MGFVLGSYLRSRSLRGGLGSVLIIHRSQISLAPWQLFPKDLIFPSPMFHNYSHSADWHIVFFLNERIGVRFLYMSSNGER